MMNHPGSEHYKKYLNKIKDIHALVIGDSMLDRYLQGNVDRISPEAPVPILKMRSIERKLGGAANVATNIKALGAEVTLISTIGNDLAGRHFLDAMETTQLNTEYITPLHGPTTVKTRIMSGSQHILRVDEEEVACLQADVQNKIIENINSCIEKQKPNVIVLQDYNKGLLSEYLISRIREMAQKVNIPICVDPKFDNFFAFKGVHIFKPNLAEVQKAVPIPVDTTLPSLDHVDNFLRERLCHEMTVITLGGKGVYLNNGDISCIIDTTPRDIIDVCGAGDAVIASIALTAGNKLPLEAIGQIANTAGGLICEKVGVATVPKEQFVSELMKNSK